MSYWIRVDGKPPFHGPLSVKELATAVRGGQISSTSEYLQANGQSHLALLRENNWRPISELLNPQAVATADAARRDTESNAQHFPALRLTASLCLAIALAAFLLGIVGLAIAIQVNSIALGFVAIAWTLTVPLFLWASGEIILVFLQIEENTRPIDRPHSSSTKG